MGICKFNYRSQACGLWLDVIVTIPTSQFSYYDMREGARHNDRAPADGKYPEVYRPGMKFQTIYMIHGGGDDDTLPYRYMSIERYADANNVMLVTPNIPNSFGVNTNYGVDFIGNAPMVSSLFIKVPREKEVRKLVKTIFDRAAKEIGDVPIVVANDGDVTALVGAMSMGVKGVMGMAMGTSEAVGYVDRKGNVLGWFNELAFAPVDLNEKAMADEWSTDIGVGCKYFSQDAVIKLAPAAGIELDPSLTPAEKLLAVQALIEQDDPRAVKIYESIGCYLAHTINLYCHFYDICHLIVLGRVMSGRGGEIIMENCKKILRDEYPAIADSVNVMLPDERMRRVGQSVAAASLPEIR